LFVPLSLISAGNCRECGTFGLSNELVDQTCNKKNKKKTNISTVVVHWITLTLYGGRKKTTQKNIDIFLHHGIKQH